jgi:putative hydrolase
MTASEKRGRGPAGSPGHLREPAGADPALKAGASGPHALNVQIAEKLRQMADLLEAQGEDGFRVNAYRRGAATVQSLPEPVDALLRRGGRDGLIALPTIGEGIAGAICEMLTTGRWVQLERLTGIVDPEALFRSLPGIGPRLAHRLHEDLGIETLEQLELAAHDGRLETLAGVGARRAEGLRALLNTRLGRLRRPAAGPAEEPSVSILLSADEAYRRAASEGRLPTIAPRRFNPSGRAWLPVMHRQAEGWRLTLLFSNTRQAHQMGRTRDWVVIYFHDGTGPEGQRTVVTEAQGPLSGRRVVRGREQECEAFYACPSDPDAG